MPDDKPDRKKAWADLARAEAEEGLYTMTDDIREYYVSETAVDRFERAANAIIVVHAQEFRTTVIELDALIAGFVEVIRANPCPGGKGDK